jgi:hypothetical protein
MDFLGSEYQNLPAEPAHAFIVFEDRLNKRLMRGFDGAALEELALDKRIKYVTDINQFISVFSFEPVQYFDLDKVTLFELAAKHFDEFYAIIQESVSAEKMRLVKQNVNQVFTSVELEVNAKSEIRGLVAKVKMHLDKMELHPVKKDSLYKKLNVFLDEVDRSRTGLAAFAAAQVQVAYEAGLDEKKFEKIVSYFERIMKALGRGSKEQPQLPKPEEVKQIEGPRAESDNQEPTVDDSELDYA